MYICWTFPEWFMFSISMVCDTCTHAPEKKNIYGLVPNNYERWYMDREMYNVNVLVIT